MEFGVLGLAILHKIVFLSELRSLSVHWPKKAIIEAPVEIHIQWIVTIDVLIKLVTVVLCCA